MNVYRIHIRPTGGLGKSKKSFDYCLKEKVLGVGWQVEAFNKGETWKLTWEEYKSKVRDQYDRKYLLRAKYIKNNVKKNDLIWTRDFEGAYYLGKVVSEWEYFSNPEARDVDITNIVRCKLRKIQSVDSVPGKVIACFRSPGTIQRIRDVSASNYSKILWNKLSGTKFYDLSGTVCEDIYSLLSAEETEDVVFIYLQMCGWIIVPNSRKGDTMSYEFYAINRKSKERAVIQVKTGHVPLSPIDWRGRSEKVFLFQSNGVYTGKSEGNVVCLDSKKIKDFMYKNKCLLPLSISHWLDVAKSQEKI